MKNIILIIAILSVGAISYSADMHCSIIINDNLAESLSKDLKFSGAYEETFELMKNADFEITVFATGGHFYGISVFDKSNDSFVTTDGTRLRLAKPKGIETFEKLRILCI